MTSAAILETDIKQRVIQFVSGASIEATPYDENRLADFATHLPQGTNIYVAHPPRWQLQDVVRVAVKLQQLGLQARPHIAARALHSERELRHALTELNAAGIKQILLIAGDRNAPAGPFSSTLDVLASGATVDCGVTSIGVAGHPEGHEVIGPSLLWDALLTKQAFAQRTGTQVHVVTQFGFNPQAVFDWQRHGRTRGITLPVHVGLAGPTTLPRLMRFAMQCGIGASLHALMKSTSALTHLAHVKTTPEEMLVELATRHDEADIVKPHFFCFGGSTETARWLRAMINGAVELNQEGTKFSVRV